ncbi:hypothetical protein NDN08_006228 [Rhodosorus marinus]|uniref:RING-type E3 ubiquitin transferase n=1 Tax=Rhodosorus marinus TaxID=101924 RepID=A0AAV8UK37_9RHOD|nr:hypothetical protein NDN08_006228 [Rhodosorus marinus]
MGNSGSHANDEQASVEEGAREAGRPSNNVTHSGRTLGPRPSSAAQVPQPTYHVGSVYPSARVPVTRSISESVKVKNKFLLVKDSWKFVRDESDPSLLLLTFDFHSYVPGTLSMYFLATDSNARGERRKVSVSFTEALPKRQSQHKFAAGQRQSFTQKAPDGLPEKFLSPENMVHDDSKSYYPVVLVMEVDINKISSPHQEVSCYVTFGYIARSGDSYEVRAVKKTIIVNEQQVEMFEIYGLDHRKGNPASNESECVICLSEEREIAILPCRHLCLCGNCAQSFFQRQSDRCPVCRVRVENMLRISLGNDSDVPAQPTDYGGGQRVAT